MTIYDQTIKEPYEKDGYTWYEADFRNLSQMQLFLKENPDVNTRVFPNQESMSDDYGFHGESLDQAIEYLITGYTKDYDKFLSLRKDISQALDIKVPRRKHIKSQVGNRVHMANFVANKPKCMLRLEPQKSAKFANIHFNLSYPAHAYQRQITNRGILTLNLIKVLEMNGYQINLDAFSLAKAGDEIIYVKVNLKNPGEILDEKKCYFPFCAREFPRRNIFRIRESMDVHNRGWGDGYGQSQEADAIRELLHIPENDIIISSPRYMGIHGDDIYEDTNNFFENLNLDESIKVKKITR